MASITIDSQLTGSCSCWIYDTNNTQIAGYGSTVGSSIDLSNAATTGINYRIYFFQDASLLPTTIGTNAAEPNGYTNTSSAFSFVEYNFSGPQTINLDVSYINDWASPIQINDGSNT